MTDVLTTCAVVIFWVKGSCITSVDGIILALILALATYMWTITLWLRYVDDTFTAVHKDGINDFHEHLNRQNMDIQFTKEIEENSKIPFLDCLDTCDNNRLWTTNTQKTDTYRQITRPVFVQPNLSQGYYYSDFDETSPTSLWLTWQPTRWD